MEKERFELDRLTEEEFEERCTIKKCPRYTSITKNCKKDFKRKKCYEKYLKKMDKEEEKINSVDEEWEACKLKVTELDGDSCRLWECLAQDEKKYLLDKYYDEYIQMSKIIDCAHIVPRSEDISLKYDENNVVKISRYFHSLIDKYLNPVTREKITREERIQWLERAKSMRK
jgi:hypothetical protein